MKSKIELERVEHELEKVTLKSKTQLEKAASQLEKAALESKSQLKKAALESKLEQADLTQKLEFLERELLVL